MDMPIDLRKKEEKVTIILAKKGLNKAPIMRVAGALDISGSMNGVIRSGALQRTLDQLLGVAVKFDDNGEIDIWQFNTSSKYVGTCSPDDFGSYVDDNGIFANGGTAYVPPIRDIADFMFEADTVKTTKTGGFMSRLFGRASETTTVTPGGGDRTPVLVLFITDGEPYERESEVLKELSGMGHLPIYFQMVGVGNSRFDTLRSLADKLDNVGFVCLKDFDQSDDEVYDKLITDELVNFVKRFPAA